MPKKLPLRARQCIAESQRILQSCLERNTISYTFDRTHTMDVVMHAIPLLLDHAIVPILVTRDEKGNDRRNDGGLMELLREPIDMLRFDEKAVGRLYNHFKTVGDVWRWVSAGRARAEDRNPSNPHQAVMTPQEVTSFRLQLRGMHLPC